MKRIVPCAILLALLASPAHAQAPKAGAKLAWGLGEDQCATYTVSEAIPKGNAKFDKKPLPNSVFVLYGGELDADGTNHIAVTSSKDVPAIFLFQLPKDPVHAGMQWPFEKVLFEDGAKALPDAAHLAPVAVQGTYKYLRDEELNGVGCAVLEGELVVRTWTNGKPGPQKGTLSVLLHYALQDGKAILERGVYIYDVKGEEITGVRAGAVLHAFHWTANRMFERDKDLVKLDIATLHKPIDDAIAKGVAWLRKAQQRDGRFADPKGGTWADEFKVGLTGLATMALLHSGVKGDDPQIKAAFDYMSSGRIGGTYEASLVIQAIEAKCLPMSNIEDVEKYDEKAAKEKIAKALTAEDRALLRKCTDYLLQHQTKGGTWGYPEAGETYDHSNTQYAILGLKSASRCGMPIPTAVWTSAAQHFLKCQFAEDTSVALSIEWIDPEHAEVGTKLEDKETPGAWGYLVDPRGWHERGYASMTCAGLTSVIIAQSELFAAGNKGEDLAKDLEKAKKAGLAYLQEHFTVRASGPASSFWSSFYLYYLYSLERVGVLYRIRKIGGHDWYLEGALNLTRTQVDDGSWAFAEGLTAVDTSFALLFLKRATLPVRTK